MKSFCAFAPATIANFNVGFDILGLSLTSFGDKVEVQANNTQENRITEIINGAGLPTDPAKNCCSYVIRQMQEKLNRFEGVDIRILKGFASGSGLGSSSASSAAAAFAYNHFLGNPFTLEQLVMFAAQGEKVACGTAHLDNVAPAILGGLVLIQDQQKGIILRLPLPDNLYAVSFFPNIRVDTAKSRGILKTTVDLAIANRQTANMGTFVAALFQNNIDLLGECLHDLLVEPMRKMLIPHFDEMKVKSLELGAIAFGISGSGPSIFALCKSVEQGKEIKRALEAIYKDSQIETQGSIEELLNQGGARLCEF